MTKSAESLAAELERESVATRRLLERVPADKLGWKPHPKAMSLGQLAHHVATIPGGVSRLAELDGMDAAAVNFEPAAAKNASELIPALEAGLARAKSVFENLDDETASATWRLTFGDREIFSVPRVGMIRTMMLNHWYHHRGQLAIYLRILDVPVPATYGRSADETPFQEA